MMAGLSPALLKQLEAAGFYVFRDPPPVGAVGPLKVRSDQPVVEKSSPTARPATSAGKPAQPADHA